jgi:Bacterial Ig-like domain (group 3)
MNAPSRTRRFAAKSAASVVVAGALAVSSFGAIAWSSPARAATVSVDTTYLADTLGLPTDTVIETVTYDRFQWLLQQPGQYAFLIGSASDAGFPAKAVQADAAAKAAGAAKIYWYDPNLTGLTGIQNLNTRVPSGINLAAASQTIFGNTWKNVLGQYLGNGIKSVPNAGQTTATISADDTVINDADSPVWDYRTGQTAAVSATDDVFFVYDKDHTSAGSADKIVSWVDLTTNADVPGAIGTAFTAAGGGVVIDQLGQFEWWKASANRKHDLAYTDDARYGGDILTDADNADGWRVKQITYPELVHLLNVNAADSNFALLFGGTWCHNTRAVIKDINSQAQANGVATVYNFDLVLDGGTTNGTNSGTNPIHVRDSANSGTTLNFRPSWVYGDVVRTYLKNLVTEYDPNTGSRVSYYPGGNLAAFPDVVRKLQVPFLINYQRGTGASPSSTSIKRQWIQQNTDASTALPTFKEYMSEWWFTHPSAQLGLNFAIPADELTLTSAQATSLAQARANAAFGADALAKLDVFFGGLPGGVASTQTVTAPAVDVGTAPTVTLQIANSYGKVASGTATLSIDGLNYPVAVDQNAAVFTVAKLPAGTYPFTVTYPGDAQVEAFTKAGTLTVNPAAAPTTPATNPPASTERTSGAVTSKVRVVTVTVTATPKPSVSPGPSASPKASTSPTPSPKPSIAALPRPVGTQVPAAGEGNSSGSGPFAPLAIGGTLAGAAGLAFGSYKLGRRNPLG